MTNSNLTAAAANLAATRLTSRKYAAHLDADDNAFAAVAETLTEQLDNTGLYEATPYADLSDEAYNALAERVAELLS